MAKSVATTRQTSNKAGVRSTAKKMDTARHGFDSMPASRKVTGASGREDRTGFQHAPERATAAKGGKGAALERMKASRRG